MSGILRATVKSPLSRVFHSCAPSNAQVRAKSKSKGGKKYSRPSSQLKLAALHATRLQEFDRDALPHSEVQVKPDEEKKERNLSFRRLTEGGFVAHELGRRRGTWAKRKAQLPREPEREVQKALPLKMRAWTASSSSSKTQGSSSSSNKKSFTPFSDSGSRAKESKYQSGHSTTTSRQPDSSEKVKTETKSRSAPKEILPILKEFVHPPPSLSHRQPPRKTGNIISSIGTQFSSPPLMEGLRRCLLSLLGPQATPTEIQIHSINQVLPQPQSSNGPSQSWKQYLLASETGSGKSIAYLLPLLQSLKQSELDRKVSGVVHTQPPRPHREYNPRSLVLAPTHELARQLSGFAKALSHEIKLRVVCASQANVRNTSGGMTMKGTAREMKAGADSASEETGAAEFEVRRNTDVARPVDVMVGTPMKLLEMVKGRGWDRIDKEEQNHEKEEEEDEDESEEGKRKLRRGRDKMVGFGRWKKEPEMGLANVEWVIVDEADVLFDPDFQETTRLLLSEISAARGHAIPFSPDSLLSTSSYPAAPAAPETPASTSSESSKPSSPQIEPHNYPFNLLLTSATIPAALHNYLSIHHPKMQQLVSSKLHHLPKTLQTEYVDWSGGNKLADIEKRIRRVWAEDSVSLSPGGNANVKLSKVLIFCNKSTKVESLGEYLEEKGIKNIAMTSTSKERQRGSNKHLAGFLKERRSDAEDGSSSSSSSSSTSTANPETSVPEKQPTVNSTTASTPPAPRVMRALIGDESRPAAGPGAQSSNSNDPKEVPHVMITTSLLSRGLDFSPDIKHVFIVDEPRNILDFLHRAGRSGRAGERGKVVVFGKYEGRGSGRAKEVRKKVNALVA